MNRMHVIALGASLLAASCATTTQIISEPPGAKVHDDKGTELGTTPYSFESKGWLWESAKLELRKDGYQNKPIEVKRSEIDVMPTIGAAALTVCLLPTTILWVSGPILFLAAGMKFPAETKVTLEAGGGGGSDVDAGSVPLACPAGLPIAMRF
jgi:hypothetical protein